MSIPLEVCIDNAAGLAACVEGRADRIELCSALALGGLTPSYGLMTLAAMQSIPVHTMIRPQAGGFVVTNVMVDQMLLDIEIAARLGSSGIVIGALTDEGELDVQHMRALIAAADGLEITLHRAFDLTPDPLKAMETAIELGIDRILTSGLARTAPEGSRMLRDLVGQANGRIRIAAGSGLTVENIGDLVRQTGVDEVHASCSRKASSQKDVLELGFASDTDRVTDAQLIRHMKSEIARFAS